MEITKQQSGDCLTLSIIGRLDGYWSDHLAQQLDEVIRDGAEQLQLDLSGIDYISSAGIRVLLSAFKQMQIIGGSFSVTHPSELVKDILTMSGLLDILASKSQPEIPPLSEPASYTVDCRNARLEVFSLSSEAQLGCRILGASDTLTHGQYSPADCHTVKFPASTFGIGLGALGSSFEDCRTRFGEFVAAAGTLVYQPTDGTNVPDYLVSTGSLIPELQLLHGILFEGTFAVLVRFEANTETGAISLANLAEHLLDVTEANAVGVVMIAESAGLIGAALRRSPALEPISSAAFEFPEIRQWLSLTSEQAFPGSQTLVAGILARSADDRLTPLLRPLNGDGLLGHLHAAACSYHAMPRGRIDLRDSVTALFETQTIQGVLHLLNDERERVDSGQSEFYRGACWMTPITEITTA